MSVQEKLDIAQAEAEAVAVGLKMGESDKKSSDEARKPRGTPKKANISGRPRRRKSTLSPDELDCLLGLN
jgi:hypothetical protein